MHAQNIISHMDLLEQACSQITDKFQVDQGQIAALLNGVDNLKKNHDAFIPQIAICGDHNVGKSTMTKFLFHELWPELVELPSGTDKSIEAPTVIRFTPAAASTLGQRRTTFETNYYSREEYIDAVLWTLENLVDHPDKKTEQAIIEARASRRFEDIAKACDAALAVSGGDKPSIRKHFRMVAEDCRDPQKVENTFKNLAAQSFVKTRDNIAAFRAKDADPLSGFIKSVTINVTVDAATLPSPFQVVDLPGLNTDAVLSMHYAMNMAQKHADAFIVCLSSAEPGLDDATVRYFSKLIGRDSRKSSRARVLYALTKSVSTSEDREDTRFSETLLENLIATHHWAEPGLALSSDGASNNIFVVDGLAGVMHDLRATSDLNNVARKHLGVANDQEYKAIKKKWNAGRVGQDNSQLKLTLMKFVTYTLPKENFVAVKSAAMDLIAKYKSIVAGVNPEQSKWHIHSLNTLQLDARERFNDCTAAIEAQVDVLQRTLRHDIISKLTATLAIGKGDSEGNAPSLASLTEPKTETPQHNGPKLVAQQTEKQSA